MAASEETDRTGWTINGRPLTWTDGRVHEPDHDRCAHGRRLDGEHCAGCAALDAQPAAAIGDLAVTQEVPAGITVEVPMSRQALEDNSFTLLADARLAYTLGLGGPPRRPTLDEARDTHRRQLADWQALHDAWAAHDAAWARLRDDAATESSRLDSPFPEVILTLHAPVEREYAHGPICDGCDDGDGFEEGNRAWPCTTATLIARELEVELPERPDDDRPAADAEPPKFVHPDDWQPPPRLRDLFPMPAVDADRAIRFGTQP